MGAWVQQDDLGCPLGLKKKKKQAQGGHVLTHGQRSVRSRGGSALDLCDTKGPSPSPDILPWPLCLPLWGVAFRMPEQLVREADLEPLGCPMEKEGSDQKDQVSNQKLQRLAP